MLYIVLGIEPDLQELFLLEAPVDSCLPLGLVKAVAQTRNQRTYRVPFR